MIAAGSTSNTSDTATIDAVNNTMDEPDRTTTVDGDGRQAGQGAGSVTGASLTLEDDDAAPGVTLALAATAIARTAARRR